MTHLLATTAAERTEFVSFVVLAPVSVLSALGMVLHRNAVYSALLLPSSGKEAARERPAPGGSAT